MAYTQEYLDSVLQQAKEHLPPALFQRLHLAARNSSGGRARHRKPEDTAYKAERPRNQFGLNASETLAVLNDRRMQEQRAQQQGLAVHHYSDGKFSQSEAVYEVPAPASELACGTCRFFLRREESELGRCQAVDGDIAWFATCQYYISADEEAEATFPQTTGQPEEEPVSLSELLSSEPTADTLWKAYVETGRKACVGPWIEDGAGESKKVATQAEFLIELRRALSTPGTQGIQLKVEEHRTPWNVKSNPSLRKTALEIVPPTRLSAPVVFVSASPGPNEAARGTHLAGPNGRIFRDLYLKALGLEMQDVGFIHATPQQGGGKHWDGWLDKQLEGSDAVIVALGGAAKKALNGRADFILPYPSAIRRKGDSGEVARKMRRIQAKVLKLMVDRVLTDSIFSGTITLDLPGIAAKSLIERPVRKDARALTRNKAPIIKVDAERQVVYGVVLTPYVVDTQKDWVPPADIEEAAHRFIRESRVIGKHHNQKADADPVETFVEPYPTEEDRLKAFQGEPHKATRRKFGVGEVRSGEWVLGTKVHNADDWASIKLADEELEPSDLGSYSMGGVGIRVPMSESEIPAVEFIDLG